MQIGAGFAQSPSPPAENSAEEKVGLSTLLDSWDFMLFSELPLSASATVESGN